MKKIKSAFNMKILKCYLKVFLHGFLSSLVITFRDTDIRNRSFMISLLIGAVAAGLNAVVNIISKKGGCK